MWELGEVLQSQGVFSFRIARFSNVYHLSMHFPKNFGAETTKIFYIGLKGEWTEVSESREKPECGKGWNSAFPGFKTFHLHPGSPPRSHHLQLRSFGEPGRPQVGTDHPSDSLHLLTGLPRACLGQDRLPKAPEQLRVCGTGTVVRCEAAPRAEPLWRPAGIAEPCAGPVPAVTDNKHAAVQSCALSLSRGPPVSAGGTGAEVGRVADECPHNHRGKGGAGACRR